MNPVTRERYGKSTAENVGSIAGHAEIRWRRAVQSLARRPGILLDLGGGAPFQGYISPQSLGPDTFYACLDISLAAHPNIVGDALDLPLATGSVDSVFCNAVLEHVAEPSRSVDEVYRVLRRPGKAMVAVPFIYPYHDRVDYYRFTDSALQHLFRRFDHVEVMPVGDYVFSTLMFLTGFHFGMANRLDRLTGATRGALDIALAAREHFTERHSARDYQRALARSPVGWHVYAEKH